MLRLCPSLNWIGPRIRGQECRSQRYYRRDPNWEHRDHWALRSESLVARVLYLRGYWRANDSWLETWKFVGAITASKLSYFQAQQTLHSTTARWQLSSTRFESLKKFLGSSMVRPVKVCVYWRASTRTNQFICHVLVCTLIELSQNNVLSVLMIWNGCVQISVLC